MTAVPSFLCSQAVPILFTTTSDANGSAWSHRAIKLSHYFIQADKLAPSSEPLRPVQAMPQVVWMSDLLDSF